MTIHLHESPESAGSKKEKKAEKIAFPIAPIVFGGIALAGLATRLLAAKWDEGGCFFQVWVSGITLVYLVKGLPRMAPLQRTVATFLLLPLAAFLVYGSLYFAPQALFPFMFAGFACAGALFLWSQSRRRLAALVGLLLLPLGFYCEYGVNHMVLLSRVRNLAAREIREMQFTSLQRPDRTLAVADPKALKRMGEAFRDTSPYSPNHESIRTPWRLVINLDDGSAITMRVGDGNRVNPGTVWVQFGVEVYQNPDLRRALAETHIELWGGKTGVGQ